MTKYIKESAFLNCKYTKRDSLRMFIFLENLFIHEKVQITLEKQRAIIDSSSSEP